MAQKLDFVSNKVEKHCGKRRQLLFISIFLFSHNVLMKVIKTREMLERVENFNITNKHRKEKFCRSILELYLRII